MQDAGVKEPLKYYAKELKLPTFGNPEEAVREYRAGQSLEEFVLELLKREYDARQEKKRQRRLKRAHFPLTKTLEEFDLTKLQHVKPEYVKQLASCNFSTVITTNLEFSKWTEMFANATLVAALVDRLTYRSHILNMNGKSYRLQSQNGGMTAPNWLSHS